MGFALFFCTAAVAITALGAWIDLRTGHIPNWLTLGSIALAPLLHGAAALAAGSRLGVALLSLALSAGGAVACALLPAAMYARQAMGGGDVKLFAAVGAVCHPLLGLRAEVYSFAFGGLYALAIVCARKRLGSVLLNLLRFVPWRSGFAHPSERPSPSALMAVRFGPAIFAGTVASIWITESERWISR